jgi:spermidine synthase
LLAGGRLIRFFLLLLYAASGALALVYEIAWARRLSIVFGSSHLAAATGLIAFMGGLALGARLFSARAARVRNPLRTYAVLEMLIGAFGLASPWILDATQAVYLATWPDDTGTGLAFVLYRFALVAVTLVIPTATMGATVPVMTRVFASLGTSSAAAFGLPLGANTAGAVLGTVLSGFVLLPRIGLQATLVAAGIANVLVGALAWVVAARFPAGADRVAAPEEPRVAAGSGAPAAPLPLLLSVAALTGACGLGLEIAWTRLLALVLGSTAYAFTVMLGVYLCGLALGTLLGSALVTRPRIVRNAPVVLGVLLVVFGATTWAGLHFANELPFWFMSLFRRLGDRRDLVPLVQAAIAGALMLAPATASGAVLPLVMAGRGGRGAREAGLIYAVNTAAGILAVALVTFVTIPAVSVRETMAGAVVILAAAGAVIAVAPRGARLRGAPVALLAAATIAAALAATPPWRPSLFATAVYRYADKYRDFSRAEIEAIRSPDASPVLYDQDGFVARVTVVGPKEDPSLLLDGKGASAGGDVPTEILLAQIPMILHEDPRRALVIGQGAGVTTSSVLVHPGVERVVAVELERKVLDCAPFFRPPGALPDPRMTTVENDGRNFLLATGERFDVICSQPSNPWVSGASSLFTAEAYRAGARRLAPRGVFCQWLQTFEMSHENLRVLVRTFADEFRHSALFCSTALGSVFLVGSEREIVFDRRRLALARTGALGVELRRAVVETEGNFLGLFYFRDGDLKAWAGEGLRNTDDNAFIEFALPFDLFTDRVNELHANLNGASRGITSMVSWDPATPGSERSAEWSEWARVLKTLKRPVLSEEAAAEAARLR